MALIADLVTNVKANTKDFNRKMSDAEKRAQAFSKGIRKVGKVAGVAFAAATVAAGLVVRELNKVSKEIDKIAKTSRKLGLAGEELQFIQFQANLAGVGTEKLNMGLQRMIRRVSEAAQGTGEAQNALKELNLDAEELAALRPDRQFSKIGEALREVSNQADRVRLGFKLFDSEGVDIINAFTGNVRELRKEFEGLGVALTQDQLSSVEQFRDELTKLSTIWQGFRFQVTAELAEPFADFLNNLRTAVKEMGGFKVVAKDVAMVIRDAFGAVVKVIGQLLNLINKARQASIGAQIQALELAEGQTGSPVMNRLAMVGRFIASGGSVDPNVIGTPQGVPDSQRSQRLQELHNRYNDLTRSSSRLNHIQNKLFDDQTTHLQSSIPSIAKHFKAAGDSAAQLAKKMEEASNNMITQMINSVRNQRVGEELERILGTEIQQMFGGLSRTEQNLNRQYAKEVRRANPGISEERLQKLLPFQPDRPDTGLFDSGVRRLFEEIRGGNIDRGEFSSSINKLQGRAVGLGPQFVGVIDELRKFGEAAGLTTKEAQKLEIKVVPAKGFDLEILNSENVKAYIKNESKVGVLELTERAD